MVVRAGSYMGFTGFALYTARLVILCILFNWGWLMYETANSHAARVTLKCLQPQPEQVEGYRLYARTHASDYQLVSTAAQQRFTVAGLEEHIPYFLAATAWNSAGESTACREMSLTVYEDAEDGTTQGWSIYSGTQGTVESVFDDDLQSQVIHFNSHDSFAGYRLTLPEETLWNNADQFMFMCRINFDEQLTQN